MKHAIGRGPCLGTRARPSTTGSPSLAVLGTNGLRRPLGLCVALVAVVLGTVVLGGSACDDDEVPMCIAPAGAVGTCEEACDRLYAIECLIGKDRDDCVSLCGLAIVPLADDDRDRVLACYAASSTCEQVDHCGRSCGEGSPMIRFGTTDGGLPEDMGSPPDEDMGPPDEPDAGPPEEPDGGGSPSDAG